MASVTEAVFFKSAGEWRRWLSKNHDKVDEIVVGLVKVGSGLAGIGYREALDEALCFGWIDGVRRSIDDRRWTIRFTPRRKGSIWSAVNRKRIAELERDGRMAEPGRRVFHTRDTAKQQKYSFENRDAALDPAEEKQFRANKAAWKHFSDMPKSYRHPAVWWVVSAKRPETRERRLTTLIDESAAGRKIKPLRRPGDPS